MTDAAAIARSLITQFEGCRLRAYQDVSGLWTVGWGCRYLGDGSPVTESTRLSAQQADAFLELQLRQLTTKLQPLPDADPHRVGACLSLAYKIGASAFLGSTLLRKWRDGDIADAAAQFPAWCHANGAVVPDLVRRRALERAVFCGGDPTPPIPLDRETVA